jgi:polar amino acid transport system permease protein
MAIALYAILTKPSYHEALKQISQGLPNTLLISFAALIPAVVAGSLIGVASLSRYTILRNAGYFYLATVGGVPTIVMIAFVAFVAIPTLAGWAGAEDQMTTTLARGIIALIVAYSAIFADVFRLGPADARTSGAGGTSSGSGSRTLTAAAIAFAALLKDSSLVSVLAVREAFQWSRLFAGKTFQFNEAYLVVIFLYLALTIPIRLLQEQFEQRWMIRSA